MNRKFHLTRSRDFARVKSNHQTIHHSLVVMVYARNELDYSRAAIVASKKIGNAVIRNRARRRIRACLSGLWVNIKPGWDFIFYARQRVVDAQFSEIQNAILHLLEEAGAL